MDKLTVPMLYDTHLHLRQDELMRRIAPYTTSTCDRIIVMPNTKPPLFDPDSIKNYVASCNHALGNVHVRVHATAKLLPGTTPTNVVEAMHAGAVGFKLYPEGVTTNSGDGIPRDVLLDPTPMRDVFKTMADYGLVLMVHGEMPDEFCMDREEKFHCFIDAVMSMVPHLQVSVEHVTTEASLRLVKGMHDAGRKIGCTITAHHLVCILDDVVTGSETVGKRGGKLRADNFCMPIAKRPEDRDALVKAACEAPPWAMFGSDSAIHEPGAKYCDHGCAGVWSAPVMAQTMLEVFEKNGALDKFADFTCNNAHRFHGSVPSGRTMTFAKENWVVPKTYDGLVPFRAGETLRWLMVG